jgi:hypothetical protein
LWIFLKKVQTARPVARAEQVEKANTQLSIRKQCEILNVARSGLDYVRVPEGERSLPPALQVSTAFPLRSKADGTFRFGSKKPEHWTIDLL